MQQNGILYDAGRDVRGDKRSIEGQIRTLISGGLLPEDWDFWVKTRRGKTGVAIDIAATSPRPIFALDPASEEAVDVDPFTSEAREVRCWLVTLHDGASRPQAPRATDERKFGGLIVIQAAPGVPYVVPTESDAA